jgi:ABC-type uncharacterized transport system involved in gliding motility auxiliary subunit
VKRIAAIFLLGLLLFNWVGYQFYTAILQSHADKEMVASLDKNNYTDADLISIRPKEPDDQRLVLTRNQQQNMLVLALLLIPGVFIVMGIREWWSRR